MAIVNPNIGAGTGSLLRKAEELNQQSQLLNKPSAQVSSPLRQLVRTTLLSPLPPGTSRVVGQSGEPILPAVAVNTPAGTPMINAPTPVAAPGSPVGMNPSSAGGVSSPGGGNMGNGGANPSPASQPSNSGGARVYTPSAAAVRTSQPAVLGASSVGSKQANPVPQVNVAVPSGRSSYSSNQAWQQAQNPVQQVLGGIGKVGTAVTTALNLPQLAPGGIFKQLQNKMAPTINRILPNFNWNKG